MATRGEPSRPALAGRPTTLATRNRRLHLAAPLLQAGAVLAAARVPAARDAVPALGLFTGPLGLVLLGLAVGVFLCRAGARPRLPTPPAAVLFALSFALFAGVALHYARAVEPSGDEIDYLFMAQSLWRERDLDLRDNYTRGDYLEYLGGLDWMPGGTRRADGRPYPIHSPGLAALVAPAYALGGRVGCLVLLGLVASALGLVVRALAREAGADEAGGLAAWAATVGPPVLFYTAFLYTEVPSALALSLALFLLLRRPDPAGAVAAALALSALPWLHVKMSLAAALLGLFALARLRGRARVAFAVTAGAAALAFLGHYYSVFGTLSPLARYLGGVPIPMQRRTPLRTLVGLFVDGAYGLLPVAPVFLLGLAGLPRLARGRRDVAVGLGLLGLGVLLPVLGWRNWWGASPPARFTIPFLPVLAVALALRMGEAPARGLARWRVPLVASGLVLALFMFHEPREMRMVNGRNGPPEAFEALAGEVSPSRYLPFLSSRAGSVAPPWEPPPSEAFLAAAWVAGLGALLVLDRVAQRRDRLDRWFRGLALPLGLLALLSLAVDYGLRPQGPPRYRPAGAASASPAPPTGE